MVIMVRKARRILSIASVALASSGAVLYGSHYWDPNDFGMVRIGRAVLATATISCDYLAQLRHIPSGTEEYNEIKSQVHLRSAQRLLDLCCANRGTFIKVGQHIGALEYLLPPEYTSTLQVLHSQAPSTPISDVQRVIHEELGREVSDLFLEFEETPLGAASLAQVHRAVLRDGRTVAVKVQHPKVQTQSARDIRLMEVLLHVVKIIFPQFEFMWLVEEAKKNLPLELDFLKEGRNAEKMAELVRKFPFLRIPKIHWDLSTPRVLVMEYLEGGQVNDKEYMERNRIDVDQVSHALGKLYSEMIFVHGFVHCDPHPGNVLVCQKPDSRSPEIILLDHGLYQVLTDSFRLDYCGLWQSLISADMKGVRKYSQRLGAGEMYPLFACMLTARSWDSVNRGIDKGPVSREEALEIRSNAASYLPQISQLLASVPRQMLLLLKTNDLLRGIETSLRTKASSSSFLSMSRCCVRALARHNKEKAASLWSYAQISLAESLCLGQLRIYEILLCLQDSFVGRFFHNVLRLVHIYLL
ncbi:aarF domain-containing protein kinase 1 isoform X1 [Bombina bombina]|uniref:aarF domain-containing protein kinase 1 isoform X1 n=1 Tax=Bombina bombina TaxID=8345 RepID=UPI00235B11D7|nr:aarF domain-containing protein kinase 1 isoform X1 [Bombina bombina]XP_053553330.1 aarF domain-containing protein kinase 1 isoform X1 [Bombina bombina]XP_053553331.1 aarF domain-containing protein kinase 1 isoform X1 [Bombina bombina]XP_053553332.1 aarF domain-containing protein kinase 1 isoform X1 [Bombina bombina]